MVVHSNLDPPDRWTAEKGKKFLFTPEPEIFNFKYFHIFLSEIEKRV